MAYVEAKVEAEDGTEKSLEHHRAELHALIWAIPILAREAGVEQVVFPMHEPDITFRVDDLSDEERSNLHAGHARRAVEPEAH